MTDKELDQTKRLGQAYIKNPVSKMINDAYAGYIKKITSSTAEALTEVDQKIKQSIQTIYEKTELIFESWENFIESFNSEEELIETARLLVIEEIEEYKKEIKEELDPSERYNSLAELLSYSFTLRFMREALYRNNDKPGSIKWDKQLFLNTIADTIDEYYPSTNKPLFVFVDEKDGNIVRLSFKKDEKTGKYNIIRKITASDDKQVSFDFTEEPRTAEQVIEAITSSQFFNLPTSTPVHLINELMISANNLGNLPSRKKNVSKGATYSVKNDGNRYELSYTKGEDKVVLEVSDIEQFIGKRNQAKKMFNYSLIKANQQILNNGDLIGDTISFTLQELVDLGMYGDVRSARAGFIKSGNALTSLKVKGHIRSKNQDTLEVLFTGFSIKKGRCYLHFNYRIDWSFIVQYYTIIPKYYFKLSNRSAELLQAIFYIGRQQVNEQGKFKISFRTIQQVLNLPNENNTKNPQRDIRDAIENAIEEIEESHSQEFSNKDFQLLPVYDENANITNYLEDGYLQVTLKGDYLGKFKEIKHKQAKRIEQSKKKKK